MMQSHLSFLTGVVRWSAEHQGMEFIGSADGCSLRFVITDEALATLSGTPARGPEYDFDTYFEYEAAVHRAATAVFLGAPPAGRRLLITANDLALDCAPPPSPSRIGGGIVRSGAIVGEG
jgi:hypothetical protein